MVNQRLRGAMLEAEVTPSRLARLVEVDVKTVQRWLAEDRMPYPVTRHRVAQALGHEETYLWPALLMNGQDADCSGRHVSAVWPARTAISSETWHHLFDQVKQYLDILIYAGGFLLEALDLADVLRFKAERGTAIRVLVGDSDSAAVKARAEELGLAWLPERCRTTGSYLAEQVGPGATVRAHGTTLYASQFRFDDIMLINAHAHGVWSAQSPVLRLDRGENPVFQFYADAFERVWESAALSEAQGQTTAASR
jgi:hypothetical protein